MSASERFPNDQEPACASALGQGVSAQPSPPGDVLDGEGELVGGFSSPPSLRTQAELRRLEASALCGLQLSWPRKDRPCPSVNEFILGVGEMVARDLGAQGETFFLEPTSNKEPDVAARGRRVALGQSFIALHRKGKYSIGAHRREYLKLVGYPSDVGSVLGKKGADHDRRLGLAPRSYQERLAEFAPKQDSYYDEPFPGLEEALTVQDWLALLSPKERLAFRRMIQHEPIASDSERLARQRVRKKIRAHLEARRTQQEGLDMTAAETIIAHVDQRFDRIERFESMRAETMDRVRETVDRLAARFPDDERVQDAVERFLGDEDAVT
jgi:hypothetical protein